MGNPLDDLNAGISKLALERKGKQSSQSHSGGVVYTPTSPVDTTTLAASIAGISKDGTCLTYFLKDSASDIAGMRVLTADILSGATANEPSGAPYDLSGNTSEASYATIETWITDADYPALTFTPDGVWHLHIKATTGGVSAVFVRARIGYYTTGASDLFTSDWQGCPSGEMDFRVERGAMVLNASWRIWVAIDAYNPAGDNSIYVTFGGAGGGTDDHRARLDIPIDLALMPDWVAGGLWSKTSTVLSPKTAGDRVAVSAESTNGAISATATGGNHGLVGNAAAGIAVSGIATTGDGVRGTALSTGVAVRGESTDGNAVEGSASNTSNTKYSVAAMAGGTGQAARTLLGDYSDTSEVAAPATPAAGKVRIYAKTDKKLYIKDSTGAETDLTGAGGGGYAEVQEEGAAVTARTKLNFIGALVTAADDAGNTRTNVTITGDGVGYDEVQEEGAALTKRAKLNFVGSTATAADDAGNTRTNVTFAAIINTLASLANAGGYLKNDGAGVLSWFADLWTKTSTYLSPTTADDDLLLHDGTVLAWGDGNPGSPDTIISRLAANKAGMASGDAFRAGDYVEVAYNTPSTPGASSAAYYAESTTGRPFFIDATGKAHDLGCIASYIVTAAGYATGSAGGGLNLVAATAPGAAGPGASFTSTIRNSFLDQDGTALPLSAAGNYGLLEYAYQEIAWTSSYIPTNYFQTTAVAGTVFHLFNSDRASSACTLARVVCRIKVKPKVNFQSLLIALHDTPGTTNVSATNIYSLVTTDTWYTYTSSLIDITGWAGPLSITVTANGQTSSSLNVGAQQVDIQYVGLQLWAR